MLGQSEELHQFDIPAQPAVTGIPLFARQAKINILAPQALAANRRVNAVRSRLNVKAALRQLLAGTHLVPVWTANGAVMLREDVAAQASPVAKPAQPIPVVLAPAAAPALRASQTYVATADESAAQAAPAPAADIVVTGSRVIRNGNDSPSPTTIASSKDLLAVQPGQLNEALQILPAFSGVRGSTSNAASTSSSNGGNSSANQLNLRNMGTLRTLPLIDGLRIPPSGFNGSVDVDIVPQMLVQRVDVVTGGVSAVYGSDAVAGVVNYVMDKKLAGLKVQASEGVSSRGDGWKTDLGAAFGTRFADGRGHFEASYEFRNESGILYRSDRDWLRQPGVTGGGTTANPFVLIQDTRQANYTFGGLITSGALAGQAFKTDGVLSPFVHGQATGNSALEIGGDGAYYDGSLLTPLRSHQVFGRLDFDVSDGVKFYAQAAGDIKTNHNYANYDALTNVTLSSTNAFLAPQYQQALAAAKQTTFKLSELLSNAPREDAISNSDQWMFATGLSGRVGGYDWGVDFEYGKTTLHDILPHNINYQKLAASLDAVTSGSQIVCKITLTNPGLADDCVPLNLFGPTAGSAAAYNYFQVSTDWRGQTTMPSVSAHVSGAPFALPAGPVTMALSGEWRKTSFSAVTTSDQNTPYSCTGIAFNCTTAPRLYDQTFQAFPKASNAVWEAAYEVEVPLLGSARGRGLSVNGAARYTSYQYSGNYVTWKGGVDWRITDTLRLRGTASRDIRAPNLFDLFQPANSPLVKATDLLTGIATTVTTNGGGNPNLTAEKARTYTAGLVWKPSSSLSLAVDYYHITITGALSSVSGRDASSQNDCYASAGTSPYCALQNRANGSVADAIAAYNANPASVIGNPAYVVTSWSGYNLNIARQETYGVDLEVNYSTRLFQRPLGLRLLAAYQPHMYIAQPGLGTVDYGGVAFGPNGFAAGPRTSVTALARYQLTDSLTLDLMERWRDAMKLAASPTEIFVPGGNRIGTFATTSLNLTYERATPWGKAAVFLNVQNLFDRDPPLGASDANGTTAGLRDGFAVNDSPMGRYFTLGARIGW
ncbi:TonB-dependent receptor [Novosphingobium flavum]|uniref:TonB-dependent receptor n=1 Tax=Novosphingobium flavum TaxID=1778672 RepID=A0A7X1FTE5_9SPHN|nr:TonB-dependent receptor [Novosphingobium flavum]MBC2666655.1 TonB-dependent receptor [Novosphingobium flavum]